MDITLLGVIIEGIVFLFGGIGLLVKVTIDYANNKKDLQQLQKDDNEQKAQIKQMFDSQIRAASETGELRGELKALKESHGKSEQWLKEISDELKELSGQFREWMGSQKNVHPA